MLYKLISCLVLIQFNFNSLVSIAIIVPWDCHSIQKKHCPS